MKILNGVSGLLQPHLATVGAFAGIVTIIQFLTGILLCNDIRKRGSSKGISIIPLLGGLVLSALSIQFGIHIRDETSVKVNLIGFALSTIYCVIYYWYTPNEDKMKVWGQLGIGGAIIAALLAYCQYEHPSLVEFRFGLILTGILYGVIGAPLLDLPRIMHEKSTAGLPFPIILMGTVVSSAWLTYAIALNNDFMIYQNVVAVIICGIQLSLFIVYPSEKLVAAKGQSKKKKNN